MPTSSAPGKSVYLQVGIFFKEETGHIHITSNDAPDLHTTINNKPGSIRCHANLFEKLAKVLRDNGAPAPANDKSAAA